MRKIGILGLVGIFAVVLAGCGGGSDPAPGPLSLSIGGDSASDGYAENALPALIAVQNDGIRVQSSLGMSPERRGFASFPIGTIPVGSLIQSTDVRLFVDNIVQDIRIPGVPRSGTPVSLDVYHVYYGSPLLPSDFNTPRLFVTTYTLFEEDAGRDLPFFDYSPELQLDVDDSTHAFFELMLVARNGVVEIEDSENSFLTSFTPVLQVTRF